MKKPSALGPGLAVALALGLAAMPALAAESKDPVVATVNGAEIHISELIELQRSLPPQAGQPDYADLLEAVINNRVVADAARKENLQNDPEVKRMVKKAEETWMRRAWVNKRIKTELTDAAVKKAYDDWVKDFHEEEVHAHHILVENEAEARAIIADLKKGGDFAAIAKAKSKDSNTPGGDLGYVAKGDTVPEFATVAFALKPGETTTDPVHTPFGWHVIKVDDRRAATPPTFDEAKPVFRERLGGAMAQKIVDDLRGKAKVKRFKPDGTPLEK
ncbi:MAG: peptidylprolyl isomerase [Magnetospirillum sp.]|nr:peptidylprolyl isomerase [Magnetospirillum sp.]